MAWTSMRSLFTAIGILLLICSSYCWYWLHNHGGFGAAPTEIPVRLEEDSSVSVPFSVRERGEHYVELQYPKSRGSAIHTQLDAIAGKATLTCDGRLIAHVNLPVGHQSSDSMVLFELPLEPHRDYRLALEVAHLPDALKETRPTIKVWTDPHYNLIFPQIGLLGVLLGVLAPFCLFSGIRRQAWHLKWPFLILVATSAGILALGYAGFIFLRPHS